MRRKQTSNDNSQEKCANLKNFLLERRASICLSAVSTFALILYVSAPSWMPDRYIVRLDYAALGLLVLAASPWLMQSLEEFEFLGFKARVRALANQRGMARETAEDLATSGRASGQEQGKTEPAMHAPAKRTDADAMEPLRRLAGEYVSIRGSMPSGPERTAKMTEIFRRLERVAHELGPAGTEVIDWLSHEDAGLQLAALAWLRVHPEQIKSSEVIATVDKSNQPFIQYWALRVLRKHVDKKGITEFSPHGLRQLKRLEQQIHRGTDRHYQIRRINEKLGSGFSYVR